MQTVKPSMNHLFCRKDEVSDTVTSSGILIQKSAQEKPKTAEVINVGSSVKGYKQRDTIIYKPYSTTDIKLDGKEYFLIAEEDVLGCVVES